MNDIKNASENLATIIKTLCSSHGCEWDKAQTPSSLCDYLLEEAYELVHAIRYSSTADIKEELGDVFFLLYFISHNYEEQGLFTADEAIAQVAAKMVRRHPHVFAGVIFSDLEAQLRAWEDIKKEERKDKNEDTMGTFGSLPQVMSPLLKAYRVHSKAARAGFTWDSNEDAEKQVEAEWLELLDAFAHGTHEAKEHELGDMLFSLVELGRRQGIKSATALDKTVERFLSRFKFMELKAQEEQKEFSSLTMEEKNLLWDMAKQHDV